MKTQFKKEDLVKIIDIDNLDVLNDETNEQDIFLNDIFIVKDIHIEDDEESDLIVLNQRTNEELLIASYRFILAN